MREGWETKRLGDVCQIINGKNQSKVTNPEGQYPIYGSGGIMGYADDYLCNEGCTVIGRKGSINSPIFVETKFWNVDTAFGLSPRGELNCRFLYYFCLKFDFSRLNKSTTLPSLTKSDLLKIEIRIPSNKVQEIVVRELDTLNEIITKKKQQLEELDKLAQATFYEMFGDPILNEKKWRSEKLETCVLKIGSGSTPSGGNQSYKDTGISLIRSLNVYNGRFVYEGLAYIDENQADKLKNVIIEEGDVLLNITGASVARSCIVPQNVLPARVNQHVSIVRPKKNVLLPVFLNAQFTSDSFQSFLLNIGRSNGATREAITKNQIENFEVILPNMSIQKKFEEQFFIIESQKSLLLQSLTDTQQLFDYTMNKYFGS